MIINFIDILIIFFAGILCVNANETNTDLVPLELRSRITVFDLIFNDWISLSISSFGIIGDYFFQRIPYPNDRNTSRLFHHMDIDGDNKVDVREFHTYFIQLFHANDVMSIELGRKVSPLEIANQFTVWEPQKKNMRWKCLLDYFDFDKDLAIDYNEFKSMKANQFDAFNCLICIKYINHCLDFRELYLIKI